MAIDLFLRGLALGFSIAAPVGPIGVLCIRRTLAEGRAAGFASGLGAAVADGLYGAVAAYGLTAISRTMQQQQFWLRLVGGVFLCWLGVKTCLARAASGSNVGQASRLPSAESASAALPSGPGQAGRLPYIEGRNVRIGGAFASTLFLTLTNPMTIISFGIVFAGLELGGPASDYVAATAMVLGVFLGSAFWWLLLSTGVGAFRERLQPAQLRWGNRLSGLIMLGFGLFTLLSLRH